MHFNDSLINLSELANLNSVQELDIELNNSLNSLNGLQGITSLNVFSIRINALTSLVGLENINSIVGFTIEVESSLTDLCALTSLFTNGTYNEPDINIINNAYNPTVQDIIDGNCSQ